MFTTGDLIQWNALSPELRDLARRYFLMYPEQLAPTPDEARQSAAHEVPMVMLPDGTQFRDRRTHRRSGGLHP